MTDMTYIAVAFGAFFAILNPPGNMPLFLAYTRDLSPAVQRYTALLLSGFIFAVMVLSMFFGEDVLHFFGISIPAFQIAGGIIIFTIAMSMMSGMHTETINRIVTGKSDVDAFKQAESAVPKILVPLGIPIYCGPGAISTAVLIAHQAPTEGDFFMGIIALAIIVGIITLFNMASDPISRVLGSQGVEILVRLMGLILAAIGVQLFLSGIGGSTLGLINPAILKV
jgi:multiple antibiotic resistance protein